MPVSDSAPTPPDPEYTARRGRQTQHQRSWSTVCFPRDTKPDISSLIGLQTAGLGFPRAPEGGTSRICAPPTCILLFSMPERRRRCCRPKYCRYPAFWCLVRPSQITARARGTPSTVQQLHHPRQHSPSNPPTWKEDRVLETAFPGPRFPLSTTPPLQLARCNRPATPLKQEPTLGPSRLRAGAGTTPEIACDGLFYF